MTAKAILSTTLLQHSGDYRFTPLTAAPAIAGIPHHVGHPATRFLLDREGGVYTPGLFLGLEVGEYFFVAQLRDARKGQAFTVDHPGVEPGDLKWGLVTRLA